MLKLEEPGVEKNSEAKTLGWDLFHFRTGGGGDITTTRPLLSFSHFLIIHPTLAAFPCISPSNNSASLHLHTSCNLPYDKILISSSAKMRYSVILPAFAAVALAQVPSEVASLPSVAVCIALGITLTSNGG